MPTALDDVAAAVGLNPIIDIGNLPPPIAAKKPRAWKRILGALLFPEHTAFVDLSQPPPRRRLTIAHEIGHQILPWHAGAFMLDDRDRLLGITKEQLEREAYLAGGHLLFQGTRFVDRAMSYQVSINTPIALADEHGASMHATIRYYTLHVPVPVAVVIAGRYGSGTVPVWDTVASPVFVARFGDLANRFPERCLQVKGGKAEPYGDIAHAALTGSEVAVKEVPLLDLNAAPVTFVAEAFFNQHNLFVMLTEKRSARFGRRVRVEAV